MTLTRFVTKSAFRNKRRSLLTVLSIAFSLLLLTLMMTIWHAFYIDKGSAESAQRLITRHRVSLTQVHARVLPRENPRPSPASWPSPPATGLEASTRTTSQKISSPSSAPTRTKFSKFSPTSKSPPIKLLAWQRDRAGVIVDDRTRQEIWLEARRSHRAQGHHLSRGS